MAYKVFTSYAVLDRNTPMTKFMKRFSDVLRLKLGTHDEDEIAKLVFFDYKAIRPGDEWTAVLGEAVREAEMLICLVSPTYLGSDWCGRELEVFHRRYGTWKGAKKKKMGGRFIFPVLWEVDKKRSLPKKLTPYQFAKEDLPKNYERGLRNLADLKKYSDAFKEFVEFLADSVRDAIQSGHTLPEAPAVNFDTIPSAFSEVLTPYDVLLWATTPDGDAWKPTSTGEAIGAEVTRAAAAMRVLVHPFCREGALADQISKLSNDRLILLVIADAHTAPDANLAALNRVQASNSIALILVDAKVSPGATPRSVLDWLSGLPEGNLHRAAQQQYASSCAPTFMSAEIEKIVTRARLSLISADPAAKAEDPAAETAAQAEGISTSTKASLTGANPRL